MRHPTLTELLSQLRIDAEPLRGTKGLAVATPIDGSLLAHVPQASTAECNEAIRRAVAAQRKWLGVPAPRRGDEATGGLP